MRLISACLALLLGIVTARKEILKRQGDYYLRLHNQGGNLVLDEGIYMITLTPPLPSACRGRNPARDATKSTEHVHQVRLEHDYNCTY